MATCSDKVLTAWGLVAGLQDWGSRSSCASGVCSRHGRRHVCGMTRRACDGGFLVNWI